MRYWCCASSAAKEPLQMMMGWLKDSVCGWSWNEVNYNNKITRKILQFKSQSHLHPCAVVRRPEPSEEKETCRSHTMFFHTQSNPFPTVSILKPPLALLQHTLIIPDLTTRTPTLCRLCVLVQILPLMMLQYNTQVDLDLYLFSPSQWDWRVGGFLVMVPLCSHLSNRSIWFLVVFLFIWGGLWRS